MMYDILKWEGVFIDFCFGFIGEKFVGITQGKCLNNK